MRKIWMRLKDDIRLAVITTVGACALIGITPFFLYRVVQADWLVVAVDLTLLLSTFFTVWLSWRHGSSQLAMQLLALLYGVGAIIIAFKLQPYGLYWFYCLILFNFFILSPIQSTLATLCALVFLCGYGLAQPGSIFSNLQQLLTFTATALISSLFAFIFSWRTAQQRLLLQELAGVDPLTGLGNRRSLTKEMAIAVADHQRHGQSFGLLLMDLDNFKKINDLYGHAEGDRVLAEFSDLICKVSRRSDRAFRLGGEEFVLLMHSIDHEGMLNAVANILKFIADNLRSGGEPVTVSIGGALLQRSDDAGSWLHKADICMYQAKQQGRNQSVIHAQGAHKAYTKLHFTSL